MEEQQIHFLGDVERLVLNPGDTIVIKTAAHLTREHAKCLRAHVESVVPGHRVLVLTDGMEIGVLGAEEARVDVTGLFDDTPVTAPHPCFRACWPSTPAGEQRERTHPSEAGQSTGPAWAS